MLPAARRGVTNMARVSRGAAATATLYGAPAAPAKAHWLNMAQRDGALYPSPETQRGINAIKNGYRLYYAYWPRLTPAS